MLSADYNYNLFFFYFKNDTVSHINLQVNLMQCPSMHLTGNLMGSESYIRSLYPSVPNWLFNVTLQGHPLRAALAEPDYTQQNLQLRHETATGSA